jgi:hypothetical protein
MGEINPAACRAAVSARFTVWIAWPIDIWNRRSLLG